MSFSAKETSSIICVRNRYGQLSTCFFNVTCKWCFLPIVYVVTWIDNQWKFVHFSTSSGPIFKKGETHLILRSII